MKRRPVALASIKAVHTLAWLSIESSIVYLLYAGLRRQSDWPPSLAPSAVASRTPHRGTGPDNAKRPSLCAARGVSGRGREYVR
jgi:hypothetical protein